MGSGYRVLWIVTVVVMLQGCGGAPGEGGVPQSPSQASQAPGKRVHFVGFDASEPLVEALQGGEDRGPRRPEPARDGRARGQDAGRPPGEAQGRGRGRHRRDARHAREHDRPEDRGAREPAEGRERQRREPLGGTEEEVAGDRHPQGDDARVLEDDPRRGAEGGRGAGQRRGDLARAAEGRRPVAADPARAERDRRAGSTGSSWPRSTPRRWSSRSRRRSPREFRS